MDTTVAIFAWCLLALSPLAQTGNNTSTVPPPTSPFNLTDVMTTSPNSTVNATAASFPTEGSTQSADTSPAPAAGSTESSTESTSYSEIPQSSTSLSNVTNSTTTAESSRLNLTTADANQTTVIQTTTSAASHSSQTVATTSVSENKTTQGLGLNPSEKRMTIVFSVVLGTVVAIVMIMLTFHKCKHKIQYLHQPLSNADNSDGFSVDGDTLVISGGLYDGHPIYDNVPPPSEDQSQFRLEFLH